MHRRLLFVALGLFAVRLALLAALLPPWQQPDEHVHVAVAELWSSYFGGAPTDTGRQSTILQSMAANGWWRHYTGGEPPDPLPSRFDHTGEVSDTIGVDVTRGGYPPLYYAAIGLVLSTFDERPVSSDMSAMRVLSALLAMATLWVAWRASTEALGADAGVLVACLLALHPQFAIVSTAASPDSAIALCGAIVVWMGWRALGDEWRWRGLLAMLAVSLAAAEIDRSGLPLLAITAAVTLVRVCGRRTLAVIGVLGLIASLAAVVNLGTMGLLPVPRTHTAGFAGEFLRMFFDTWWFAAGWLHYRAPGWWLAVAMAIAVLALAGALRRFVLEPRHRAAMLLAALAMAVQLAAIFWVYYRSAIGPQGRYLFPVMVPAMWFLALGVTGLVPPAQRHRAAAAVVIVLALLDTAVLMLVTLPAYAF